MQHVLLFSFNLSIMSSVKEKLNYLVDRYVSNQFINSYPKELNLIIIKFLGNVLLRFDIVHPNYRDQITGYGTIIKRPKQGNQPKWLQYMCFSSTTFTNGIHEFRIKCIKPNEDAVGIVTGTSGCKSKKIHWASVNEDLYFYYGGGFVQYRKHNGIWASSSDLKCPKWEKNDIITVNVDCYKWILTFSMNNKMAQKVKIVPNKVYYPFMGLQYHDVEYHLIV